MAAYSGAWFLGWNFQRPDPQLVRPWRRNTLPFQKLIDFWTSKRTKSSVNVTKPELLLAVLFKAMCHGFCVFNVNGVKWFACLSAFDDMAWFCHFIWSYHILISLTNKLVILATLKLMSSFFMNRFFINRELFTAIWNRFPFVAHLFVCFKLLYSWYLGKLLGIRHVWSLKHATSILLQYRASFWRGIPNGLSIAWIQILTFGPKKTQFYVMSILIFIPVVC